LKERKERVDRVFHRPSRIKTMTFKLCRIQSADRMNWLSPSELRLLPWKLFGFLMSSQIR
jgi:hypothetical protein